MIRITRVRPIRSDFERHEDDEDVSNLGCIGGGLHQEINGYNQNRYDYDHADHHTDQDFTFSRLLGRARRCGSRCWEGFYFGRW